jgi:pyruvate/2-oxoglutarate dehydrogenase complex dihydrolipoamide dehydrogenase (E3) component
MSIESSFGSTAPRGGEPRAHEDPPPSSKAAPAATSHDATGPTTTGDQLTAEVVVLGAGSGGQPVAEALAGEGVDVVVVEAFRVGGECPYVACIPSKALLVAAAAGVGWDEAVRRRDAAAERRDDSGTADGMVGKGVRVLRGTGTVTGPGTLDVVTPDGDRVELRWTRALVVGTGSAPVMPPVDGIDSLPAGTLWTSADALSVTDRPGRLLVLGGGAVGCELGQAFARLGSEVTLVEVAPGLLADEQPWVGDAIAEALRHDRVDVRLDAKATRFEPHVNGMRLHLADGSTIDADRLLVAGGRRPRGDALGLEGLGVQPDDGALRVDARCRVLGPDGALPDVYAVGDVTGIAPFTHTATYQAEIVTDGLLGRGRDADYRAVPRVVYTDPSVFCVGVTEASADRALVTAAVDVEDTARAFVERPPHAGRVELLADPDGTLVGAAVVAPHADSWAGELALAVRAGVPVSLLADHVHPHPAWSEALHPVSRALGTKLAAVADDT